MLLVSVRGSVLFESCPEPVGMLLVVIGGVWVWELGTGTGIGAGNTGVWVVDGSGEVAEEVKLGGPV